MNKLILLLITPIVVLSIVSGLLLNQLIIVQNENSELRTEIFGVTSQLEEEQTVSLQLECRLSELGNRLAVIINKVKIIDFRTNGTIFPAIGGIGQYSDLVVTVANFGINDVENLTVVFDGQYYTSDLNYSDKWEIDIGTVKVGESKTVNLWDNLDGGFYANPASLVAQLMLDDMILDNRTLTN